MPRARQKSAPHGQVARARSGGRACRPAGARAAAAGRAARRRSPARAGAPAARPPRGTRRCRGGRSRAPTCSSVRRGEVGRSNCGRRGRGSGWRGGSGFRPGVAVRCQVRQRCAEPATLIAMNGPADSCSFDGFDELDAMGPWEVFAGLASVRDDVTARLVTLEGARAVRADHGAIVDRAGGAVRAPRRAARPRRRLDGSRARGRLGAGRARRAPRRDRRASRRRQHRRVGLHRRAAARARRDPRRPPRHDQPAGARRPARRRRHRRRRGARRRRRRRAHRRRAAPAGSTSRCTCCERFGGPGLAEAAARELQYERPALAVS